MIFQMFDYKSLKAHNTLKYYRNQITTLAMAYFIIFYYFD